jgi:polyisoprenoid-binding protein YceI
LLLAASSLPNAHAQMGNDGHRGVCSDCHVGAANDRYELNTADSIVVFALDAFGFSKTIGTFHEVAGGFRFDPAAAGEASVLASVNLGSLEMSDAALNELVLSERFLDARRYPSMTFQSSGVEAIDGNHFRVDGTVSLRGVERPLALAVELNKLGPHPLTGRQTAGLVVTGRLKRSDFGMTLGLPNVGDEIEFTVYAQGTLLN